MDSNCIFCKIVQGEIPIFKIYEDQKYLAFLDLNYFSEGHTVVIPKEHYKTIWEMYDVGKYFEVGQKIAKHFHKVTGNPKVKALVWGEEIPHAHYHLIPNVAYNFLGRFEDFSKSNTTKLTPEKGKEISEKFKL